MIRKAKLEIAIVLFYPVKPLAKRIKKSILEISWFFGLEKAGTLLSSIKLQSLLFQFFIPKKWSKIIVNRTLDGAPFHKMEIAVLEIARLSERAPEPQDQFT